MVDWLTQKLPNFFFVILSSQLIFFSCNSIHFFKKQFFLFVMSFGWPISSEEKSFFVHFRLLFIVGLGFSCV